MMRQRLSPGVQNGDDADLGAEMAWIGGERRSVSAAALNRMA